MAGGRILETWAVVLLCVAASAPSCGDGSRETGTAGAPPEWTHAFLDTCPVPEIDTSTWTLIEGGSISFRIPPNYAQNPAGIDVEAVNFANEQRTIGYCVPCAPWIGDETCTRCRETIDGREGFIIAGRGPDGRYFTGATWRNRRGGHLTMGGFSPDAEGQREALAVIRSVRFKPAFDKQPRL